MDPIYTSNYWYYTYLPILYSSTYRTELTPFFQTYVPVLYNQVPLNQSLVLSDMGEKIREVENTLQDFTGSESVLSSRTLEISSGAVTGTVESGAPIGTHILYVSQLATPQTNTGTWLNSSNLDFSTGAQTFSIDIGGETHTFTVDVQTTDTNASVLNEIANAINESGIGIEAKVETSGTDVRLILQGEGTGVSNSFSVYDVSGSIVSTSGISNISQQAQNMVYTLDGIEGESESNTLELPGVKLEINSLPEGEVNITVRPDVERISTSVQNLLNGLNELSEISNSIYVSPSVSAMIESIMENPSWESLGIINENGSLVMTDEFEEMLSNPSTARTALLTLESLTETIKTTVETMGNLSGYQFTQNNFPAFYTNELYIRNLVLSYMMNSFLGYA